MSEMRRVIVVLWIIFLSAPVVRSQDADNVKYIAELLSKEPEDLTEEEIVQYLDLLRKPIRLNMASKSQLSECGLFTRHQVASLMDYKERSGQILSYMELSAVDGFGDDLVCRIRPFVSLDQTMELGGKADHEITVRTALRSSSGENRYSYASRYKVKSGELISASVALSRSLDSKTSIPDAYCASLGMRFRRLPVKIVVGDFNVRYGQGLALWSGTDFSSLNDPSTFMRRSSGVSVTSSFTGTKMLTGTAAELNLGRFSVSAIAGFTGLKTVANKPEKLVFQPALHIDYAWRYGQIGFTQTALQKSSVDMSACFKGVDVFSELMFDWKDRRLAGLAGVVFPAGDMVKIAAMLRSQYPEHLAALSVSMSDRKRISGTFSSEATMYSEPKVDTQDMSLQVKIHTQWQLSLIRSLVLKLRVTERVRSWGDTYRTDLRADLLWQSGLFNSTMRLNVLNCKSTSFLTYLEGGFKSERLSIYLRQGLFLIDDWSDRIYAYERDVPGCYNSPAFYGRGVWTSCMTSWKVSKVCKLYFRAGYTAYPFMEEKKPGKAELRFQTVLDF